jgi:hypothetical protein
MKPLCAPLPGDAYRGAWCARRAPLGITWKAAGPSLGAASPGPLLSVRAARAASGENGLDDRGRPRHKLHSARRAWSRQTGSMGGLSNQSLKLSPGSVVAERHVVVLRALVGCGALVGCLPGAA